LGNAKPFTLKEILVGKIKVFASPLVAFTIDRSEIIILLI